MNKVLLRFGTYETVTQSGQDGTTIQFPFAMLVSSMVGTPEEFLVTTFHRLRVGVASRINWGDETFLAHVLFTVGKQEIVWKLYLQDVLSELETVFIPHGECPVDPGALSDPKNAIVEVEIP